MKGYIRNIVGEYLREEVDVNREWIRLVATLKGHPKGSTPLPIRRKHRLFRLLSYPAAAILGVLLTLYVVSEKPSDRTGLYKLETSKGEKSHLQLPDGTQVWLNSCTSISYAPDYGTSNRNIHLDGEAYFEVAPDKKLPFIVKAAGGIDVKAVGTAFNVQAYRDESLLITTLFSGKVIVQPTLTMQQIPLNPNQVAIYAKLKNELEVRDYDKRRYAQWRSGSLSFEMMPLEEIAKLLERNYNVRFQFQNKKIKKMKFSGNFRDSEDLSEILKILTINVSVRFKAVKDTIIVQ